MRRSIVVAAVIAGAALIALVAFLLLRGGDEAARIDPDGEPVAASESDLVALANRVRHPVYWIGDQDGTELEVTRLKDDRVYVRYVEEGRVGDPRPRYFTVGSYVVDNAFEIQQGVANGVGVRSDRRADGGLVIQSDDAPSNVYIAFPDHDVQVEVFDKDPERAFRIATSSALRPVG